MYIQYVGFNVGQDSRIYSFDVIEAKESRHFTVEIRLEAFQPLLLRFQDGPDISFMYLKKGLEEETDHSRALAHLNLGEPEVRAYVENHRPAKALGKRF